VTKRQADYYLHRIYKLLADPDTMFRHRKFKGNLHGIAYADIQGMIIDMRKEALTTILHEALHLLYDWPEKKIREYEKGIADHMSQLQWQNLCYRIGCM